MVTGNLRQQSRSQQSRSMIEKSKIRAFLTARLLLLITLLALGPSSVAYSQSAAVAGSLTPSAVENQVEALLSRMTLEEKIDLIGGVDGFFVRGMPSLGLPPLKMADGPM